ncbi:hypothetical protein BDA96_05G106200 [Sorghum bicolor]|uniref:Uncharacterized protein n=2 Tax=Sorghum bicolor TaxID=4558 RepID=A0A921UFD0_SORBI|nr:hypothetical protein BDA96_05G106200 [Sorghum bicolor]OQU83278.1 hypothetical protein SORBI_3005G102350 [Sorghum bicolor]
MGYKWSQVQPLAYNACSYLFKFFNVTIKLLGQNGHKQRRAT